jgi:protein TonB
MLQPPPLRDFYPRLASRRDITGTTRVRLHIDRNGRVSDVTVLESQPARIFDRAARRAARQMRYDPAMRNGRPVPDVVELKLVWETPQ